MASALVLFFPPAVLISGHCTRKLAQLEHPAQEVACKISTAVLVFGLGAHNTSTA